MLSIVTASLALCHCIKASFVLCLNIVRVDPYLSDGKTPVLLCTAGCCCSGAATINCVVRNESTSLLLSILKLQFNISAVLKHCFMKLYMQHSHCLTNTKKLELDLVIKILIIITAYPQTHEIISIFLHWNLLLRVEMQNGTLSEGEMQTVIFNFRGFFCHTEETLKPRFLLQDYIKMDA